MYNIYKNGKLVSQFVGGPIQASEYAYNRFGVGCRIEPVA